MFDLNKQTDAAIFSSKQYIARFDGTGQCGTQTTNQLGCQRTKNQLTRTNRRILHLHRIHMTSA